MGRIYAGAQRVLVWLGPTTSNGAKNLFAMAMDSSLSKDKNDYREVGGRCSCEYVTLRVVLTPMGCSGVSGKIIYDHVGRI
jgi:hypothetical protein